MSQTEKDPALDGTIERVLVHAGGHLVVSAPLGLGKPHRMLNALYARVAAEPSRRLSMNWQRKACRAR